MQVPEKSASRCAALLVAAMLLAPSFSIAQELPQPGSQPAQPSQQQSRPSGVAIDPSAGPLQPSATPPTAPLPEAPAPQPATPAPQTSQTPPPQPAPAEPLGAAAAEQIRTAGGGASRPAGNAIAPVKQHQYRSLLIKLGAVAAAGIAVGTVYGLSHATSSTPPHSASAATK